MSDWRSSPLKRLEAAAISAAGYRICAALGATWTWRVEGAERYDEVVRSGRQPTWRSGGRILPSTIFFKRRGIVVTRVRRRVDRRHHRRFGYGTARVDVARRREGARPDEGHGSRQADGIHDRRPAWAGAVAQAGAVWCRRSPAIRCSHFTPRRAATGPSTAGPTQVPSRSRRSRWPSASRCRPRGCRRCGRNGRDSSSRGFRPSKRARCPRRRGRAE